MHFVIGAEVSPLVVLTDASGDAASLFKKLLPLVAAFWLEIGQHSTTKYPDGWRPAANTSRPDVVRDLPEFGHSAMLAPE